MHPITFQYLNASNLALIASIDRSEHISGCYRHQTGRLILVEADEQVAGFEPLELALMLPRQARLLLEGGVVIGAFAETHLVGVASLESKTRGSNGQYRKMDLLYVSKAYRGQGIARRLLQLCKIQAGAWGGNALYISATPSQRTADFYFSQGARLAAELDPELFALEPADIHLEISL